MDPRLPPAPPSDGFLVRHRYAFLAAVGTLVYVAFLGARGLWFPDEPNLAVVARGMVESGDWIVPRRNGEVWLDYPPLLYWLGALSSRLLGGVSVFALRLPSALAALVLVLATCRAASRAFDARTGLWAGLLLLTFEQFAMQAPSYRPDMVFAALIGVGFLAYVEGLGPPPRWGPRILAFACFGLAVLAKGPLGLLLPGLVLVLFHLADRTWRRLLDLVPLTLVALAVVLPWALACAQAVGSDTFLGELFAQNFQRFGSDFRGHGRPPFYYLAHLPLDLAIWSPLLPFAFLAALRRPARRVLLTRLSLGWFATFLVFLSLAVTKREVYLLPAYPAAALLLAPWLVGVVHRVEGRGAKRPWEQGVVRAFTGGLAFALPVVGALSLLSALFLPALVGRLDLDAPKASVLLALRGPLVLLGVLTSASGAWILTAWRRGEAARALVRAALFQIPILLLVFAWVLPTLDPAKSYAPAGRWIRAEAPRATDLGLAWPDLGRHKQSGFAWATGLRVHLLGDREAIERFLAAHPASLVLVHAPDAKRLLGDGAKRWRPSSVPILQVARRSYLVLRGPKALAGQR
ncbi:MAG: ArnT family glycosyltransferase [Planctomycetota bacterium]